MKTKLNWKYSQYLYWLILIIVFYIINSLFTVKKSNINYGYLKNWFDLSSYGLNYGHSELIDPKDPKKEFSLNPRDLICDPSSNKSVLLITMVAIAPSYFGKRTLIRSTWGNKQQFGQDMKLIFLLAKSLNETINKMIDEEFKLHNDIVQKNYTDSYYNLTAKIMMGLNWISKYCPNSKYILRINDDVIVNTFNMIKYFNSLKYEKNQIFGYGITGVSPIRDPGSKFYVSEKEYPKSYYDPYIEGSAYLFTTDLAATFYNKYLEYHCPPFSIWLEDVYIG